VVALPFAAAALVCASVLLSAATAVALSTSQAQTAVSAKLARTYGSAWVHHGPAWSRPECRHPGYPKGFSCNTEFEYQGVWRNVSASVQGGRVTLYLNHRWVRRWTRESTRCTHQAGFTVVGQLSTNDGGCDDVLLYQNFGFSGPTPRVVRYTGFKRTLFYFGTLTALWPDFFLYHCNSRNGTYQCTNRFGDGLRWKPSAAPSKGSGPLHVTDFLSADRKVWCSINVVAGQRAFCASGEPSPANPPQRAATLYGSGKVTLCYVAVPNLGNACVQNWDSAAPVLKTGEETEADGVLCKSQTSGVTCTLVAGSGKGKGFFVSSTTARRVGP
jgi:hypothetical protein